MVLELQWRSQRKSAWQVYNLSTRKYCWAIKQWKNWFHNFWSICWWIDHQEKKQNEVIQANAVNIQWKFSTKSYLQFEYINIHNYCNILIRLFPSWTESKYQCNQCNKEFKKMLEFFVQTSKMVITNLSFIRLLPECITEVSVTNSNFGSISP